MANPHEMDKKTAEPASVPMSTDEAISMFDDMAPSKVVVMRRELEHMFPAIIAAINREVSEEQIIAGLRKKWSGVHVATIVKLLNAERERRLAQDELIKCKPFGSPRKPKMRTATMTGEFWSSPQTPQAAPQTSASDKLEVSA
jgi:hypothetical protein